MQKKKQKMWRRQRVRKNEKDKVEGKKRWKEKERQDKNEENKSRIWKSNVKWQRKNTKEETEYEQVTGYDSEDIEKDETENVKEADSRENESGE